MIRTATIAALIALLAASSPAFSQPSGEKQSEEQKKQEEAQRARAEQVRLRAEMEKRTREEALKAVHEAQRLHQEMLQEQQSAMKAMQEGKRRAEEMARRMLIEPYAVPWEVDREFYEVRVLFDMASAQHEITVMLIEDGKYDEAVREASKIITLGLPERYDLFLLNEIDELSSELQRRSQDLQAIRILEVGHRHLRHPEARAGCLIQVAKIYRRNNQRDLAIKAYRDAIALNQQVLSQKQAGDKKK